MTIVLGRRPTAQPTDSQQRRQEWVNHFRECTSEPEVETATPAAPAQVRKGGPAAVPLAEIRGQHRGIYASARRSGLLLPMASLVSMPLASMQNAQRLNSVQPRPQIYTVHRSWLR